MSCKHFLSVLLLIGISSSTSGQEFECPTSGGIHPDPENCSKFYSCNDFYPYQLRCPSTTQFDGVSLQCLSKGPKVKCGPQPTTPAPVTTPDPLHAEKCDPQICQQQAPYCQCSSDGTQPPRGVPLKEIPQMVMITFDGAVNNLIFDKYNALFKESRVNPNGCPIRGTFFIAHEYTNYRLVEKLAHEGHEIAVGTISRRRGLENADKGNWTDEVLGMINILTQFGNVEDIKIEGVRAPHLKPGRNAMMESFEELGIVYDSTLTVPPQRVPIWPYTFDYLSPHECKSGSCPTRSFPGTWEIPMNSHYQNTEYVGGYCPYLDQCALHIFSEQEIFDWLKEDFLRHYNTNRAPFQITLSANWFNHKQLIKALHRFIDYLLTNPEVYIVKMTQVIDWMFNLTPLNEIKDGLPWNCTDPATIGAQPPCNNPNSCKIYLEPDEVADNIGGTRYMVTCNTCPNVYPWLGDHFGEGIRSG